MNGDPRISVIIPAYNVEDYIVDTLDSLFAQTRTDFEAIVINDGSTDRTGERIEQFRSRIRYISRENGGVMAARNAGLRQARGRYIALLDGDDLWEPEFLEILAGMLDADPAASVAFPNAIFHGSPKFDGRLYQDVYPATGPITFDRVLRRECSIFGSLVFRRSALYAVGPFDEALEGQGAEDLDLWLRMLQAGMKFIHTTRPLVRYRWRSDSLSSSGLSQLRCLISMYRKFHEAPQTTADQRDWIASRLPELTGMLDLAEFRDALAKGDYPAALSALERADRHYDRPKLKLLLAGLKIAPRAVRWLAGRRDR
ncbi:MAG: glycosyltransferase family 2 protein [Blastocatellales bacterium]